MTSAARTRPVTAPALFRHGGNAGQREESSSPSHAALGIRGVGALGKAVAPSAAAPGARSRLATAGMFQVSASSGE